MKNTVFGKNSMVVIFVFCGIYAVVALLLPRLTYFRHTPLSLWIQAINYIVLGTVGIIVFRNMIKEGINQWRAHTVKNFGVSQKTGW